MTNSTHLFDLILELNKLKTVFRNNITQPDRRESTAEHSWSATMIGMLLMPDLKKEFPQLDELKTLKLVLIHDIVEIYAGDVSLFDDAGRIAQMPKEHHAIRKLAALCPDLDFDLVKLWEEEDDGQTLEAQVAKGCDQLCPIFLRIAAKQSYTPDGVSLERLDSKKAPVLSFSHTFTEQYNQLREKLLELELITQK